MNKSFKNRKRNPGNIQKKKKQNKKKPQTMYHFMPQPRRGTKSPPAKTLPLNTEFRHRRPPNQAPPPTMQITLPPEREIRHRIRGKRRRGLLGLAGGAEEAAGPRSPSRKRRFSGEQSGGSYHIQNAGGPCFF